MEATEEFEKVRHNLESRMVTAQDQYHRSTAKAKDEIKELAEKAQTLGMEEELKPLITKQIQEPFASSFEKIEETTIDINKISFLLGLKVRQGLGGWIPKSILVRVSQLQEELKITPDVNPYALYQAKVGELESATTELQALFERIEAIFGEIVDKHLKLDELKYELEAQRSKLSVIELKSVEVGKEAQGEEEE